VVKIFDTTLRDGEQSPGCSMDLAEKVRMAEQLVRLNVDVIEAGFPVASKGDFESVRAVARKVKGCIVTGLARATEKDIDLSWEALREAENPRLHTFIATSDIHLQHKLRKSREQALEEAVAAVRHAKKYTSDVEFSAEDATRSDPTYLAQVVQAAIKAGATTINIPDTVGYTIPTEYSRLIAHLFKMVPDIGKVTISVHCHNDLGLAVANSLAAVEQGARQVECTINGIGERAGNASLEEIVMALKVRHEKLGFETRVVTEQLVPASKLLAHITGVGVQPNKAIVGSNAFAHESGIHQAGLLRSELTYSIMTPALVGWSEHRYVLGKHSGRHALRKKLEQMGHALSDETLDKLFVRFKELADKKKQVYDEDLEVLVATTGRAGSEKYQLDSLSVQSGTTGTPKAEVSLKINGKKKKAVEKGSGPVDAAFKAIQKLSGFKGALAKFSINAITGGMDAQGEVMVAITEGERTVRGTGSHTDIVVASALAYLNALNRLELFKSLPAKPTKGV
ncbi:MAG: 2-isopropylmalate synthase, partial [Deltaproteobacteria bacterium]|nr:2-isopropylmalate synthase [Deltaproteobacteria bacterium]